MRGTDDQQSSMFSYISAEQRVPKDHPLRALRVMADAALAQLGPAFDAIYARSGRPSIAPERLLRALLLQVLYSVRSERLLMEQLDCQHRWEKSGEPRHRKSPTPQRECPFTDRHREEGRMLGLEDFMTIQALVKRGVYRC